MKISAGLLMFRIRQGSLEVLLVHPGGPFWSRRDAGSWLIPKGEVIADEDLLTAAKREFEEETGFKAEGVFAPLGTVKQRGGKIVHAWTVRGNCDPDKIVSNTFAMEWPPHSGKMQEFPEVDRADFFPLERARTKILPAELPFLDRLEAMCLQNGLI